MPRFGYVIGTEDGVLTQFLHETGAFVRRLTEINTDWTASVSDFDPTTGLPNPDVLGPTDTSVPCSVAGSEELAYLADSYTARILAFDPDTGSVLFTFGGRRGIGAGTIELDGSPRSIVAVARESVWYTDNAGGFVVNWDQFGSFIAEYSISGWASDLSLSFDQITGWAWDGGHQVYWALAQSSSAAYLFAIDTDGNATGEVIDLTTRLAASLGITVGGHSDSPAERVRTRGLAYHNGYLIFWSENRVIRISLPNADDDLALVSEVNDVSPGNWSQTGDEIIYSLRDQPNNDPVVHVVDAEGALLRTYGASFSPPDGEDGHVAGPWDASVTPTAEEDSGRTSRGLSLRASIRKVTEQTLQLRASILAAVTRTLDLRARILNLGPFGQQQKLQMRARIEEPSTFPDSLIESWDLTDNLGAFSRTLNLTGRGRAGFQVGDTLTLYAGYGTDRIKIFEGEIDDLAQDLTADVETWSFSARDVGAKEAASRKITRTWTVQFQVTTTDVPAVIASTVLREAALVSGVELQGLGFPDYPLYGNFAARGATVLQIAEQLAEPWNQFPSREYRTQVRSGALRQVAIDWRNPPANGYVIPRGRLKQVTRRQTRYLQSPDLRDQLLQVKGATVSYAVIDEFGPQTRVEYFRTLTEADVTTTDAQNTGQTPFAQEYVLTEQYATEEVWGDKVTTRTAEVYVTRFTAAASGDAQLVAREVEQTLYTEPPAGSIGFASIQTSSAGPSPLAVPYQLNSVTSGIDPADGVFKELRYTQTNYLYDQRFQLASETTSVTEFDTATQRWELTSVQVRPISETTGGCARIRRYTFTNDEGTLGFDSVDSQQVAGGRPDPAQITGLATIVTLQAIAPEPQVEFLPGGQPVVIDPGERTLWSYENAFLGQTECEAILDLAEAEQDLQEGTGRWEDLAFVAVLDPNLKSGMAVSVEVADGDFVDYWLESVTHSFETEQALTRGTAKRITTTPLP